MSGEDQNITLTSMMEAINKLNSNMNNNNDSLRADMINNNNNITNNINNINDNMIKNNQDFNNKIESLQERIELRSRASSKASSRANSPGQLMAKLTAKLPAEEEPVVMETPRIIPSETEVSMTVIFKDKADADDFAEVNRGRERRRAPVSSRDNTHSYRDTFAATNRVGNHKNDTWESSIFLGQVPTLWKRYAWFSTEV